MVGQISELQTSELAVTLLISDIDANSAMQVMLQCNLGKRH